VTRWYIENRDGASQPSPLEGNHKGSSGVGQTQVLVDSLKQVQPLLSEEREHILRFFVRLEEIQALCLVVCLVHMSQPLVSGSLLQFWGSRLRKGSSWVACKSQLLEEYFPHSYRERLITDIIVFNFHGEGQSMRTYVEEIFQAADFLQ